MNFLEEQGFRLGCATFWNANISNVLLNNETKIVTVQNDPGITIFSWLAPKSLLEKRPESEFLLLFRSEEEERINAGMYTPGKKAYEDEKFVIYDWRE